MTLFEGVKNVLAASYSRVGNTLARIRANVLVGRMDKDGQLFPGTTGPICLYKNVFEVTQAAAAAVVAVADIAAVIRRSYPWFTSDHLDRCEYVFSVAMDLVSDCSLSDDVRIIPGDATGAAQTFDMQIIDAAQINHQTGGFSNRIVIAPGAGISRIALDHDDFVATETHISRLSVTVLYYPTEYGT